MQLSDLLRKASVHNLCTLFSHPSWEKALLTFEYTHTELSLGNASSIELLDNPHNSHDAHGHFHHAFAWEAHVVRLGLKIAKT